MRFLLAALFLGVVLAVDELPRATGLRKAGLPVQLRRAPTHNLSGANLAPHARRLAPISTGVRRAPFGTTQKLVKRPGMLARKPLTPAMVGAAPIPLPPLIPLSLPTLAPIALPTVTLPSVLPTLPTFPTLPTVALPTLPAFTMPPSFQRLMGITTAKPKQSNVVQMDDKDVDLSYSRKQSHGGLSSVGSRLPKYVSEDSEVTSPEKNADWIVPF